MVIGSKRKSENSFHNAGRFEGTRPLPFPGNLRITYSTSLESSIPTRLSRLTAAKLYRGLLVFFSFGQDEEFKASKISSRTQSYIPAIILFMSQSHLFDGWIHNMNGSKCQTSSSVHHYPGIDMSR